HCLIAPLPHCLITQCSRGPTPARSPSRARRLPLLARAPGAPPSPHFSPPRRGRGIRARGREIFLDLRDHVGLTGGDVVLLVRIDLEVVKLERLFFCQPYGFPGAHPHRLFKSPP